jgi:hypothetical protein
MQVSIVDLDMVLKLGKKLSFFDRNGIDLFNPRSKDGLAMIAARRGIEISYNPLWLPTCALHFCANEQA